MMNPPMYRALRVLSHIQCHLVQPFVRLDPRKAYVVFSDPRGGSTWITNILATALKLPIAWEPLHLAYSKNLRKSGFGWRQYLPVGARWLEAELEIDAIFEGRRLTPNFCKESSPLSFIGKKEAMFKFCRANSMIPWLVNRYHFDHLPLYMVRHPFAVAASQIKKGGWSYRFEGFSSPASPYDSDRFEKHREFLRSLTTKEEALVATWCLSNLIPLRASCEQREKWVSVYYEDIFLDPWTHLERIASFWQIPMSSFDEKTLLEPSNVSVDFTSSKRDQLRKWMQFFDAHQMNSMQKVLDYFGVSEYSSESPLPLP